jgi:Uma2 family endonuclease
MVANLEATIEDLYRVPGNKKAEIVNGEIVLISPRGAAPSYAAAEILSSLREYSHQSGNGHAVSGNVAFIVELSNRKSFSPDAAFYSGSWTGMKFFEGASDFAVEVRSEHDYGPSAEAAISRKRSDYFAAGSLAVWDVNLLSDDVIKLYRMCSPDIPRIFRRGDRAEAEVTLRGWSMPVDDLFVDRIE